ncbi:MAG: cytochrome c [Vicinamibacterales bacterium]
MSTMKLSAHTVVAALFLIALPIAASDAAAQGAAGPGAADKGAAVFAANKCSMCHGMDGKGNQKGALDDVGSKLTADEIRQWITTPVEMAAKAKAERKPAMKSFATLPKDDLDAVVKFLAAKKKK